MSQKHAIISALTKLQFRSFTNDASTGGVTATEAALHLGKAQRDNITPPEPPYKPSSSSEKPATDTANKHTEEPSSGEASSLSNAFGAGRPKIIDIAIHKAQGQGMLHRCALLKMESYENFMASDVQRLLGIEMNPHDESPIKVPDQEDVVPLGQVRAEWYVDSTGKTYAASFIVIETEHFDVLLGGPVIKDHQLHKAILPREGLRRN